MIAYSIPPPPQSFGAQLGTFLLTVDFILYPRWSTKEEDTDILQELLKHVYELRPSLVSQMVKHLPAIQHTWV